MNFFFICGCLEPGQDGVGDYTRRLAGELIRLGHSSFVLSYNDFFIQEERSELQNADGTSLPVLRLSSNSPVREKLKKTSKKVIELAPDWISIQFVLFSFDNRGLPLGLASQLARIVTGRRVQIMFHELWVMSYFSASKKKWVLGIAQKWLIKSLIKKLKPNVVHSHTRLYVRKLIQFNVNASYLPIFSNIPVTRHLKINDQNSAQFIIVNFGSVYPNSNFAKFAEELAILAQSKGLSFSFCFIGRSGTELQKWVSICQNYGLKYTLLGEQSVEQISNILANSTFGLSTTPFPLIEKSGSVAAMREHCLPVLCLSKEWITSDFSQEDALPGVFQYENGKLQYFLKEKKDLLVANNLLKVAEEFISSCSYKFISSCSI